MIAAASDVVQGSLRLTTSIPTGESNRSTRLNEKVHGITAVLKYHSCRVICDVGLKETEARCTKTYM